MNFAQFLDDVTQEITENLDISTCTQAQLEMLYSKHQLMDVIRQEFIDANFPNAFVEADIPPAFGLDMLAQLVLRKRVDPATLIGVLMHHFESPGNNRMAAQHCSDALLRAAEADFVDYDGERFVLVYDISQDVQDRLDQFQYPLPMIEAPLQVRTNTETGYQTIRGSLILKKNHHNGDICLDHINRVNSVPLALNEDTVSFVQNRWKDLDHKRPYESQQDYQKRRKAFAKYDRTSRDVLAGLMAQGNRFWLTHKYDKRGRTYCSGYHVSYQGNDWNKACVEFADKEPVKQE